jgi:hypothetical protein
METAEPSRHSKTEAEPVTIDLAADEIKPIDASEAEGTEEDVTASAAAEPESAPSESAGPHAPEKPAAAPAKGASGLGLFAAALIGGVVTLGGAAGLQYWGLLPSVADDSATKAAINGLASELQTVKSNFESFTSAQPDIDLAPINAKIAALEEKAATMPMPNGLSADADARIAALAEQTGKSETAIADLVKTEAAARAALEMRLEAIEKKVNAPRDDIEVATAIAYAGLKAAIDRGGPFMSEIDTLAGIHPDDPVVKELGTYAAVGVPSRAELINQFPPVADAILSTLVKVDPNQSLTDRLLDSAFSVIKVRPVGNVEGEGVDAIVARMENKLKNGDLKGVALEWDGLPEDAKAASSSFKKEVDARIRVEELVGSALSKAIGSARTNG